MKQSWLATCVTVIILSILGLWLAGCSGVSTMKTTVTAADGTTTVTEQPGSMFGPSSYDVGYMGMYQSFSISKENRATAIMNSPGPSDPVAKAYADAGKLLAVALISTERFDVKAPTTGFDVINKAVDSIVPVAGFVGMYKLGIQGIKNAGSQVSGNASVTNSMNHTEANPTTAGTNNSVTPTATGTHPAQVVEQPAPVIVGAP